MDAKGIEWQAKESRIEECNISPDGHWMLKAVTERNSLRRLSLTGFFPDADLPVGYGKNEDECWRDFIAECDRRVAAIVAAKAEAAAILARMEGKETAALPANSHCPYREIVALIGKLGYAKAEDSETQVVWKKDGEDDILYLPVDGPVFDWGDLEMPPDNFGSLLKGITESKRRTQAENAE